jgi:hypothetical protein
MASVSTGVVRLGGWSRQVFQQELQAHSVTIVQGGVSRECRVAVAVQDSLEFGNHDLGRGRHILAVCELGEGLFHLCCLSLAAQYADGRIERVGVTSPVRLEIQGRQVDCQCWC